MEKLLLDFYDHPEFVRELLETIADYSIAQVQEALKYDIDAVYFGDDWGQQRGLQMGPWIWPRFICPVLERMYGAVKAAGNVCSSIPAVMWMSCSTIMTDAQPVAARRTIDGVDGSIMLHSLRFFRKYVIVVEGLCT